MSLMSGSLLRGEMVMRQRETRELRSVMSSAVPCMTNAWWYVFVVCSSVLIERSTYAAIHSSTYD